MPDTKTTPSQSAERNAGKLFAGAIAMVLICVTIVGIDYSETRQRAAKVPVNTHRLNNVEEALKSSAKEQALATRDLARAVGDLREAIAELKGANRNDRN